MRVSRPDHKARLPRTVLCKRARCLTNAVVQQLCYFAWHRVCAATGSGNLARGMSPVRAASRPSLTGPGVRGQSWLPEIAAPPPPSAFYLTSSAHSLAAGNHGGLLQQLCAATADCFSGIRCSCSLPEHNTAGDTI